MAPGFYKVDDDGTGYYLFAVDASGTEKLIDGESLIPHLQDVLRENKFTDVVIMAHGYLNFRLWISTSLPFAFNQVRAMHPECPPGIKPLYIAFFWPSSLSTIFEDSEVPLEAASASTDERSYAAVEATVLQGGIEEGLKMVSPDSVDPLEGAAQDSYKSALKLTAEKLAADTNGSDESPCLLDEATAVADRSLPVESDLDRRLAELEDKIEAHLDMYDTGRSEVAARGVRSKLSNVEPRDRFVRKKSLSFLTQDVIFGEFQRRASVVGSRGLHKLVAELQRAASEDVRFHLFGHSLGGHVVSSGTVGPRGAHVLPRKLNTVFIAQGAMENHVFAKGGPYRAMVEDKLVSGPIVYTTSKKDRALMVYDAFYAAPVGIVGVSGADPFKVYKAVLRKEEHSPNQVFEFRKHSFHELDGKYVITGAFLIGAHMDFRDPETMRAFWASTRVG